MLGDEITFFHITISSFEFYVNKTSVMRNLFKIFTLRDEIRHDIYLPFF